MWRSRCPRLVVASTGLVLLAAPLAWRAVDASPASDLDPTLPSVSAAVEGAYDEDGCLRTGPDEVDCSVRAAEVDAALAEGEGGAPRHLQGFMGLRWLDPTPATGPRVLETTVSRHGAPGALVLVGLVRNEGTELLAEIRVTATLLAADGEVLGTAGATSPVTAVRPGEPVPFTVVTDQPAASVAGVRWSAGGARAVAGAETARALAWTTWFTRPAGGDPVSLYLRRETSGPRPELVFGGVENVGDDPVGSPRVVVGWLAPDGRLAAWAEAPVATPSGGAATTLVPGRAADALVVTDAVPPTGSEVLVWGYGS